MAATVSGSKTCTRDVAPQYTAAILTTLLATAPENMTVANLYQLLHATERIGGGTDRAVTLGSLLT